MIALFHFMMRLPNWSVFKASSGGDGSVSTRLVNALGTRTGNVTGSASHNTNTNAYCILNTARVLLSFLNCGTREKVTKGNV